MKFCAAQTKKGNTMATFQRRKIDPAIVAAASLAAEQAPLVKLSSASEEPTLEEVGARQETSASESKSPNIIKYEVGKVYDLPLGIIKPNPRNPRVFYSSTTVDSMASALVTESQQVAATAFINNEGHVVLIDGEKRLRGARAGGLATLRTEIRPHPTDDRQLYAHARSTNSKRSEQTPLDDAIRWRQLLDDKVYPSQSVLAKELELTEDGVSRTLKLAALPEKIIHALIEEPDLMRLRMLNAIREYWETTNCDDEKTLDLVQEITRRGMGYREVESRRKGLEKGPVSKPRAIKEPIKFGTAKGELKSFPDGRLELNLQGLNDEQTEVLRERLIKLLKGDD
jgi:ParB family chromosome partitioning protein